MYQLDITQQKIRIEGREYPSILFKEESIPDFALKSQFHQKLYQFLRNWFSENPLLEVQTSGSTGVPKIIQVEKSKMMQSACLTCSFLDLKPCDSILLCMSLKYIGAKMMVVRAIVADLDLFLSSPDGHPLKNIGHGITFGSMVPLQVFNSLQVPAEREKLRAIQKLIIGGGAIDPILASELEQLPNSIYSTYGMTETLSHIALRKLNGKNASTYYKPFDSVQLSLSEEGSLIIKAPLVASETLYTNDIVDLKDDGSFRVLGRKDNTINSGGVKVQAEEVEQLLRPYIKGTFAVTSLLDPKFGEIVVLVVENPMGKLFPNDALPNYYHPKRIIQLDKIPQTETGKINRYKLKQRIRELNKE